MKRIKEIGKYALVLAIFLFVGCSPTPKEAQTPENDHITSPTLEGERFPTPSEKEAHNEKIKAESEAKEETEAEEIEEETPETEEAEEETEYPINVEYSTDDYTFTATIDDSVSEITDEDVEIMAEALREEYEAHLVYEETQNEIQDEPEESSENGLLYIGTFQCTAYEWTGNPCANGNYPTEGYTVACNSLPFGTWLYIEGVGYRVVEDRGAEWHSETWLDVYLGDEEACWNFGVQYLDVYIVE